MVLTIGDAEIISIDTYTRTDHGNSPRKTDTKVIAVSLALVKVRESPCGNFVIVEVNRILYLS